MLQRSAQTNHVSDANCGIINVSPSKKLLLYTSPFSVPFRVAYAGYLLLSLWGIQVMNISSPKVIMGEDPLRLSHINPTKGLLRHFEGTSTFTSSHSSTNLIFFNQSFSPKSTVSRLFLLKPFLCNCSLGRRAFGSS